MHDNHVDPQGAPESRLVSVGLMLVLITLLGAGLRFAWLDSLPPGLYRDEAYNGLDALAILDGHTPLYFEANNGREPLFIYLLALPIALLGATPLSLRLVSAIIGTLTVPALYWLAREMTSPTAAILAAFFCATTVWSVNLSRVALRAVVMVPILAISLALWCRARKRHSRSLALLAGMAYGLSWYTYLAARFAVVALLIVWLLQWRRGQAWWRGWLLFGAGALIVAAPLLGYMGTHWEATVGRASQVSVFSRDIHGGALGSTLAGNLGRTALAWVWRGDFIPRHNIPLRPVFQPLLAAAFALGLYLAFRRAQREPDLGLALVFLGVMLLPTVLAEGAPHFLRATGALPVLYVFPALGVEHATRFVARRICSRNAWLLTGTILLIHAGAGMQVYRQHLRSEDVFFNFETGATSLAAELNSFLGTGWPSTTSETQTSTAAERRQAYIAPRLWDNWPSIRFLCHQGAGLSPLPADETRVAEHVLVAAWPYEDLTTARAALPEDSLISVRMGDLERGDLEPEPRLLYILFEAGPLAEPAIRVERRWEEGISLDGYRADRLPDGEFRVTLYWRGSVPLDVNYGVFVHLFDGDERIGQHDGPAALGYYGTDVWRPGDLVADERTIRAADATTGELQIAVGLYDYQTMERLRLLAPDGSVSAQDELLLPLWP